MNKKVLFLFFALYLCNVSVSAQQDGVFVDTNTAKDTIVSVDSTIKVREFKSLSAKSNNRFVPMPAKAVWYSALLPGLGQIYNRKYWKLPLVYGGFAGITYALAWNNGYLKDYSKAYNDITDANPSTNSFLEILPASYVKAYNNGTISQEQLTSTLKNRKDFFRRNRDLSVISMIGLYFVTMIDAYVDAQLFQFDISPDLSLKMQPALLRSNPKMYNGAVGYGLQCSVKF